MMLNSAIVFILAFGVSLSVILVFTRYFRSRVNVLKHELNHAVQNDFVMSQSMDGRDEIADLYASVDVMMWRTRKLIQEVYVAKIRQEQLATSQKDIQFKMLSSQINPHFLYNTLETIRMKAVAEKQKEIARAVLLLSKILRHSLSATDRTVLLCAEIEVMRNYFEVQQLRFRNRFTYSIDVEPGLDTVCILPLLIQPIAENSFIHGLELKKEGGMISVSVRSEIASVDDGRKSETRVRIVVADNGIGIARETVAMLAGKLKSGDTGDSEHIGLVNVNHRIKLFYGDEYGVSIESDESAGTNVSFTIPMQVGQQT
jgi:two-component system sensor histidine kinase YesM